MPEGMTRAAFAREIGVSRGYITQLVEEGLPICDDCSIPRESGLQWIAERKSSYRGGWHFRKPGPSIAERARAALGEELSEEETAGAIKVYEALRERLQLLPGILLRAEPNTEPWILIALTESLDMAIGAFMNEIDLDLVSRDQARPVEPDYQDLFQSHGLKYNARDRRKATAFLGKLEQALWPPESK